MLTDDPKHPGVNKPTASGQNEAYLVLSDAERAKGFVRPVRCSYRHVGRRPAHPLRDLTAEEQACFGYVGYVKFETYPAGESSAVGRFWTEKELNSGCGAVTTMGQAIAETYARNPAFYGATFCCGCGTHLPVGERGEFVWEPDGSRVGT